MLPFIVFFGLTIINSTEVKFEEIEKKGILAKNSNGRQKPALKLSPVGRD